MEYRINEIREQAQRLLNFLRFSRRRQIQRRKNKGNRARYIE